MHFVHFANVIGCNNMLMLKVCKNFSKLLQTFASLQKFLQTFGAFILFYMWERHNSSATEKFTQQWSLRAIGASTLILNRAFGSFVRTRSKMLLLRVETLIICIKPLSIAKFITHSSAELWSVTRCGQSMLGALKSPVM